MSNAGNGKAPSGDADMVDEVFDRAPTPTVLVRADPDRAGRFFQANQAMCALVGSGPDDLLAQTLAGVFDRPDRATAAAIDGLLSAPPAGCEFEARFHRADGGARVAHMLGSPVSPNSGAPPVREGVITAWNPAAEATFGWTGPQALGRDLADTVLPVRHPGPGTRRSSP